MLKATLLSITYLFIVVCHGQSTSQVLTFDKTTNKASIASGGHRIIEMDFDSSGNLFIFGEFNEEINLTLNSDDPVILSCWQDSEYYSSGRSLFLAKYNSQFDLLAFNQISLNTNYTRGNDIPSDIHGLVKFSKNGNCFIITESLYADQIYLYGEKKVLVPNADQHILRFNSSLQLDWVKQIPDELSILNFDIREDPNEIILSGIQSGNADFDPDPNDQYKIPNYQPNFSRYIRAAFISVYDWDFDFTKAASLSGSGESSGFALDNKNGGYYFIVRANHNADVTLKDSSGFIGVTDGLVINNVEQIIYNLNNDFSLKSAKLTNAFDLTFLRKSYGNGSLLAKVDNLGKLYMAFGYSKDSLLFWHADNPNNTLVFSPKTITNNTRNIGIVCLNNNNNKIEWINTYGGYNQKMTINDLKLDEKKNLWFSGSGSDEIGKDEYGYWSIDFNPDPDSSNYVAYYNGQVPSCDYKSQYLKYYEGYSNFLCRVDSNGQFGFAGGIYSANGKGSSSILHIATGPDGTLYGGNLSGQSGFNRPSKGARFSNSNADSTRPLIAVNVGGEDGSKIYIAKYQNFDNQTLNYTQPNNACINIFPNPVTNTIYVDGLNTTLNKKLYYKIFNLTGSIVQSGEIKNKEIRLNKGVKTGQYLTQILSFNNELLKSSIIIYQ